MMMIMVLTATPVPASTRSGCLTAYDGRNPAEPRGLFGRNALTEALMLGKGRAAWVELSRKRNQSVNFKKCTCTNKPCVSDVYSKAFDVSS